MSIQIRTFGAITAITGNDCFSWPQVADTDALQAALQAAFPALKTMKYTLAVDRQVISGNQALTANVTVALLPPFSGG